MLKENLEARFSNDPLRFLDEQFPGNGDAVKTGRHEYLLGNPIDARAVLRNSEGRYGEHSDFFHTRYGIFGPRSAQLKIRRAARLLVRTHVQACDQGELSSFMAAHLPSASDWPDTGNRLAYRFLSPVLLAPGSPPELRRLLDRIVEQAVLANARSRQPRWRRMLLQFNTTLRLSKAIEARQALAREQPIDLLDVVACSSGPEQRVDELVEVFLSFLFAIAGSVGFVLGWSLYLAGTHPDRETPPEWMVQEALRLWPVAWQLGRHPTKDHEISGVSVGAADEVVVCPYLVHRNPQYWSEPTSFQPQRWSSPDAWRNPAFIPFGYGPHRCIAADLSSQLVSAMLGAILRSNMLSIEAHETRPTVAAAMAPPPFRMTLRPRG